MAEGKPTLPFTEAEMRRYADSRGIEDEITSDINREFERCALPGFRIPYQARFRAEALKDLASPQRLAEAFEQGDVISSILPEYINGAIPSFNIVGAVIQNPEDFAKLTWTLRTPYMEVLKVAFLNRNGKAVHSAILSVGSINAAMIHPQMILREVQRIAGKTKTNRIILSHNHPSGDPKPSNDDIRSTQYLLLSLKVAGIELVDHVVTNGKNYASWKDGWAISPLQTPQPEWEAVSRTELPKITEPGDFEKVIASLRQADPDHDHVIYGDSKLQVTAVERLPVSLSVDDLALRIAHGSGREGALHAWFESITRGKKEILQLHTDLAKLEIKLLDACIPSIRSFSVQGLMEASPELPNSRNMAEWQSANMAGPSRLMEDSPSSNVDRMAGMQTEFLFDLSLNEAKDVERAVFARHPLSNKNGKRFNFSTEKQDEFRGSEEGSGISDRKRDEPAEDRGDRQAVPDAGERSAGDDERRGLEGAERDDQVGSPTRTAPDPLDIEKGNRPRDTRLNPEKPVELTPLRRVEANLKAMEIVARRRKEQDFSPLSSVERICLRQYTGWGGIANQFLDPRKEENVERLNEIKSFVGPEGLAAITAGVKNAHYTSYQVVKFGWDVAQKLGFRGGHVLEPAAGVGNIIGLAPRNLPTQFLAVELDPLSADISRLLYPDSQIIHSAFEHVEGYQDRFDLAFTNVPFGDYRPKCFMHDPYRAYKPLIHDYFILRQLEKVRPGGLCIVITGKGTMDKANGKIRELIAQKADLVVAFRLPESAFKDNADTLVTTDMLVLKKREPDGWSHGHSFARLLPDPSSGLRINEYFAHHPENMFGKMEEGGMMARSQGRLVGVEAKELPKHFEAALGRLKSLDLPEPFTAPKETAFEFAPCPQHLRVGEVLHDNGRFYTVVVTGGMSELLVPIESRQELRSALEIKTKLRELLSAQLSSATDEGLGVLQTELKHLVMGHIQQFCKEQNQEDAKRTPLDTAALRDLMGDDPDYFKIASLVDRGFRYSDIFNTRTVFSAAYQPKPPGPEAPLEDVTLFVRHHHGAVDVARIAELKGISKSEARNALLNAKIAFLDPVSRELIHRIEYLAGDDVYAKFDAARAAATSEPASFQGNVEELEKIIPAKIPLEQLSINSRQPIYDATLLQSFLCDRLNGEFTIKRFLGGRIAVEGRSEEDFAQGNANASYSRAFEAYANRETVRIRGGESADGNTLTPEEMQELQAKRQAQREFESKTSKDFESWVKDHADKGIAVAGKEETVREYVERVYNRAFNRSVSTQYDGAHLRFQGIAAEMNGEPLYLHKHNLDFAARMLFQGRGGNAHCVGAGKTFAGSLTAKAWKQSGMVQKPAFVVPKKVLRKWAKEYSALFPGDNVLVVDRFDRENREELLSRIAVSSPDAIFMTHEHAKMIPNDPKVEERLLEEELQTLREQLSEAETEDAPKRTIRSIENSIARFEVRLNDLREYAKTNRITFVETGIDALVVDESHNFKNLPVQTKEQASGIPSGSSQRSFDLYMKTRQVLENHNNRGVLLLTATPVSNTMAEVYNMVKFLAPEAWASRGIRSFDNWIDMFGEIVTKPQVLVDGSFGIRSSLSSFKNLPELKQVFESFWDSRTAEQLQLKRPTAETVVRVVEPSSDQERFFQKIVQRAEAIRNKEVEPWEDNMLALTVDGRKAALDMRLVHPVMHRDFGEYPDSKLNVVADEIWNRYQDAREEGTVAGQLVFFDLYSSKALAEVEAADEKNDKDPESDGETSVPMEEDPAERTEHAVKEEVEKELVSLDLHTELAKQLMKRGIPPEEIGILNGKQNATASAKQLVSDRYNEGKLRVVIGTTPAMGEGMNLQRITTAIHHADVPLKPSHMEQRDGRGLRQGNLHSKIEILRYTTRGSFDQYLYQILERKARFITMFMNERNVERNMDGVSDAVVLSYEEAMGATAKDPRIRDYFVNKVKLSQAEVTLKGAEQEWRTIKLQTKEIETALRICDTNLAGAEQKLAERNSVLKELLGNGFDSKALPETLPLRLKVNGKTLLDEKEMTTTLNHLLEKRLVGKKEDPRWIIAVKKDIPGGTLDLNGICFEARRIKGVEFSMFDKDVVALVRHKDVAPINVMESRTPATQLMGNVRYEFRATARLLEGFKDERSKLESAKRGCERRVETAGKNFEAARKTCAELQEKVTTLAREVGVEKSTATNDVVANPSRRSARRSSRQQGAEIEM